MEQSQDESPPSSTNVYARPVDSINAIYAFLDDPSSNQTTVPSSIMRLLSGAADNANESASQTNEWRWRNPAWSETPPPDWSVHAPETRSVFYELSSRLKEIEAVYRHHDDRITHLPVTTSDIHDNEKKLKESVEFFKERMKRHFEQFVECQRRSETEEKFLSQCVSLLDLFRSSSLDNAPFRQCATGICELLTTFADETSERISEDRKVADMYWSQYKQSRDICKLVREVQSDPICPLCMAEESTTALNCGHCFCLNCANRCNVCPYCRTSVNQRLKLFL